MNRLQQRGFTLVEVMVAIAIIALIGSAVTLANGQVSRNARMITEQQTARWLTQNTLAQMRLLEVLPQPGITSNQVDYAGLNWRVEVETTALDLGIEALAPFMRRVEIKAYLGDEPNVVDSLHALLAEANL